MECHHQCSSLSDDTISLEMHTNKHCLQGLLNYVNHMFSDTIQKSVKKISNFFSRHKQCEGILYKGLQE